MSMFSETEHQEVVGRLCIEEGFRGLPYDDHLGKATIGYGTLLPLTREEARWLLKRRFNQQWAEFVELCRKNDFPLAKQPPGVLKALADLVYNLGVPRLAKFRKMFAALRQGDRVMAAVELQDSRYYEQVTSRAERNIELMQSG